jgi:3-hydroxy-9,10-secoandrosta-1,3,5(10)-triene-9,17-dione monooxygenase reductase component
MPKQTCSTAAPPLARTAVSTTAVDPQDFRRVLGRVPTSVAVVSTCGASGPVGMTVGSLTSVSLDPPLIAFFVKRGSQTMLTVQEAGVFCVNVLGQDQGDLCYLFASSRRTEVGEDAWDSCCTGAPRLRDALAWLECTVDSLFEAGDHLGVMGRVQHLTDAAGTQNPLIFYRGSLCRLHAASARRVESHPLQWWDL